MSELTNNIRAALKAANLKATVRGRRCGYDDAATVTVKDLSQFAAIHRLANGFSVVRRCEASGEVLGGCNVWITVKADEAAVTAEAKKIVGEVEVAILAAMALPEGQGVVVADALLMRDDVFGLMWRVGNGRPEALSGDTPLKAAEALVRLKLMEGL